MSRRALALLVLTLTLLLVALSTGTTAYYLLFLMLLFLLLGGFLSALSALFLTRAQVILPRSQVVRGDSVSVRVSVRRGSPLPIGQLELKMAASGTRTLGWMTISLPPMHAREYRYSVACPHRGLCEVGVSALRVTDVFGLFTLRRRVRDGGGEVTVLPRVSREGETMPIEPGENGPQARIRMTEDTSSPAGVRTWQEGDELKRVHWKLSMRRQSLMVHTYETPQRPDALILLDTSQPQGAPRAALIDALTEACAGTVEALLQAGRMTRLPLEAAGQGDLSGQGMEAFDAMRRALACAGYHRQDDFARVLLMAAPRLRTAGSAAVFSTRLTPAIADAAIALSRMGARMRYTLVTAEAPSEEQGKLLDLLRVSGLEALHVRA